MNNLDLEHLIHLDPCGKRHFLGVFSADTLPKNITHYPCGMIFNNQPVRHRGSHWVAVWVKNRHHAIFFDSYGHPPSYFGQKQYLQSLASSYTYNNIKIQSDQSQFCGSFCVYFILASAHGLSLQELLSPFTNQLSLNDVIVTDILHRCFKHG